MNGDNIMKVEKIKREGYTEYRIVVGSALTVNDFQTYIPDGFIAATLANQIREFVNASVLGECIEIKYKELGDSWTCPCCGSKMVDKQEKSGIKGGLL